MTCAFRYACSPASLRASMATRLNAEAAAEPFSQHELDKYFKAHSQVYATSARFAVTPVYFESQELAGAQSRADSARARIRAGTSIDKVLQSADRLPFYAPSLLVTTRTLANYFGPATADLLERLAPGETTEVQALGSGVVFIYLNRKVPAEVPSLASVHDLVLADALRDRQERALDSLLSSLHKSARIEFSDAPPATASR